MASTRSVPDSLGAISPSSSGGKAPRSRPAREHLGDVLTLGRALGGSGDEVAEQRRGALGAGLELGMKLRGDEEGVALQLDRLDEALVRRGAGHRQASALEALAQQVVDLIAVSVALVDDRLTIDLTRSRARVKLDRVSAEAHRPTEIGYLLLLGQQIDHGEGRLQVELG